jgi:hypothetical protein
VCQRKNARRKDDERTDGRDRARNVRLERVHGRLNIRRASAGHGGGERDTEEGHEEEGGDGGELGELHDSDYGSSVVGGEGKAEVVKVVGC